MVDKFDKWLTMYCTESNMLSKHGDELRGLNCFVVYTSGDCFQRIRRRLTGNINGCLKWAIIKCFMNKSLPFKMKRVTTKSKAKLYHLI